MEFSINIPYRQVIFRISIERPVRKPEHKPGPVNLDGLAEKQLLAENVARELKNYQDSYLRINL